MAVDLAKLVVAFEAETGKLTRELQKAQGSLSRFEKQSKQAADKVDARWAAVGSSLRTVAGAFGVALGASALVSFTKGTIDAADKLNDMSDRTQIAVKDLASLEYAAKLGDVSMDTLAKGIQRLTLSVSQAQAGNEKMEEALLNLGVTSTDAKERLFQLADAYAKAEDKTAIVTDLQAVLSRSYVELVPLLKMGGEEMRNLAIASGSYAEAMAALAPKAGEFNDMLDLMKQNSAGLAATIISALLPSLSQYLGAMNEILRAGTLMDKIKFFTLGYINADVLDKVSDAGERVKDYNLEINKLRTQLVHINKVTGGKSSMVGKLEAEIGQLEARRAVLIAKVRAQMAAAEAAKKLGESSGTLTFGGGKDDSQAKELDRLVAALHDQADTLGMTADQIQIYKLRMAGASAEQITFATSILNAVEAEKKRVASMEEGKRITEAMLTPAEVLGTKVQRLNELLATGDINWTTYTRSVYEAQDAFDSTSESAKKAADEYARLKSMLDATPSAQLEATRADMILLTREFEAGRMSAEVYLETVQTRLGTLPDAADAATDSMTVFAEQAARNMQDALAQFLFDPFEQGLDGMLEGFANTLLKMAAEMAAAEIFKMIGGSSSGGDSSSGVAGMIGSFISGMFAGGGTMPAGKLALVGEQGPELVMPTTTTRILSNKDSESFLQGQRARQVNQVFNITTPDPDAFRMSQRQMARRMRQGFNV